MENPKCKNCGDDYYACACGNPQPDYSGKKTTASHTPASSEGKSNFMDEWEQLWERVLSWHEVPEKIAWLKAQGKGIPHPSGKNAVPTPAASDPVEGGKDDWQHLLEMCIYTTLIGYDDTNGDSIPCKERESMKDSIVSKFKKRLSDHNIKFQFAANVTIEEQQKAIDRASRIIDEKDATISSLETQLAQSGEERDAYRSALGQIARSSGWMSETKFVAEKILAEYPPKNTANAPD